MENQLLKPIEQLPVQVSAILLAGTRRLLEAGIPSARLDAELLLGCTLELNREQLVLRATEQLSRSQSERYESLLLRRLRREPLAYIIGRQEFWSLDFSVTADVLVPRPETELLVELAVKFAADRNTNDPLRIVDLGTGSGAVAVALASELPGAQVFASDISAAALAVACENAKRHGVSGSIRFLPGDFFSAIDPIIDAGNGFDLIVSNPPYIRGGEISKLEPEVSCWEPRRALDGGFDGLDFYRRLAEEGFQYLRPGGAIAVEIGAEMGPSILTLFRANPACTAAWSVQDYSGRDRVVFAAGATAE